MISDTNHGCTFTLIYVDAKNQMKCLMQHLCLEHTIKLYQEKKLKKKLVVKLYPPKKKKTKRPWNQGKSKIRDGDSVVWANNLRQSSQAENCEEVERQSPLYHYHHSSLKSGYLHIFHVNKHTPNIMQDKKYQS